MKSKDLNFAFILLYYNSNYNQINTSLKEGLNLVPLETSQLSNGIYLVGDLSHNNYQALKLVIAR